MTNRELLELVADTLEREQDKEKKEFDPILKRIEERPALGHKVTEEQVNDFVVALEEYWEGYANRKYTRGDGTLQKILSILGLELEEEK